MQRALVALIASLSPIVLAACADSDAGDSAQTPLHFTEGAIESLPLVAEDADADAETMVPYAADPETAAVYDLLGDFFHYECHEWPNANFCPPEIDVEENDGMNSTKFTADALLGLIYHAEMGLGGQKGWCELTAGSISADSFHSAGGDGADPDRFILDNYDLYTCKGTHDADGTGVNTMNEAYSVASDYQATLQTALRYHPPESPDEESSSVLQDYIGVDGATARNLAFNFASGNATRGSRVILVVSFATHRFVAKYLAGSPDYPEAFLVAAGTGGVDRSTGDEYPGHYWASFTGNDQATTTTACVDNAGQILEADDAPCAAAGVPIAWTSADEIAAYLELSAEDQAGMAPFLEKLATADRLPSSDVVHNDEEIDLYFPSSMD
jgi:hypothetical protein